MILSSVKQVLAEVSFGCPAWFGLLHPLLPMDARRVLAVLGGRDSTKVPGTDSTRWEQIYSEFSDILEQPGTPPERAIENKIDFMPDSVLPAKK